MNKNVHILMIFINKIKQVWVPYKVVRGKSKIFKQRTINVEVLLYCCFNRRFQKRRVNKSISLIENGQAVLGEPKSNAPFKKWIFGMVY
jgi:hypothetical protein